MRWSQLKYLAAILLIGDGILAMLRPYRDAQAWSLGPQAWKDLMRYLSEHPEMLRTIGAAEIAFGFALATSRESITEQLAKGAATIRRRLTPPL